MATKDQGRDEVLARHGEGQLLQPMGEVITLMIFLCWGHINHLTVKLLVFTKILLPTPNHLTVKGGCFAVTVLLKKLSNCFSTGKSGGVTGVTHKNGLGMVSDAWITMQGRVMGQCLILGVGVRWVVDC